MIVCRNYGRAEEAAGWRDYKVTGVILCVRLKKKKGGGYLWPVVPLFDGTTHIDRFAHLGFNLLGTPAMQRQHCGL